ncbi:MAG: hypothetical protein GY950_16270 [bacterium]|nr:hypothetical protein [bacterium]
MFLNVTQKHLGGIPAIGANSKDVEKFLWYFERSSIMHYHIMSVFKNKLLQDKVTIEQEIEELEREMSEQEIDQP